MATETDSVQIREVRTGRLVVQMRRSDHGNGHHATGLCQITCGPFPCGRDCTFCGSGCNNCNNCGVPTCTAGPTLRGLGQ
jgi:hypothetical protein